MRGASLHTRSEAPFVTTSVLRYYTNNIKRDPAWVLGMVLASDIRMAKVDLPSMEAAE